MDQNRMDVKENYLYKLDNALLEILLKDRASKKNIIWATDNYAHKGFGYQSSDEISVIAITGHKGGVVKPRTERSQKEQTDRIRDKAEVVTPSWICNKQNNLVDNAWFGTDFVFNRETEKTWIATAGPIAFPAAAGKSWKDYIDDVRLEITCGEAPYLASRYDTVSGSRLELPRRIGFLDRKLRVVGENTLTEEEWLIWAIKSYESIYGYDWQGDNVLLARENLLLTFIDYYKAKFEKEPAIDILKKIADILSWNIWQMDGLKFVIPESCKEADGGPFPLSDISKKKKCCAGCTNSDPHTHTGIYCRIKDWKTNKAVTFVSLLKKDRTVRFDVIVGNPPYQLNDGGNKASASPIYNHFVRIGKHLDSHFISMIMPAKWYSGGKGLDAFRTEMLNDTHISRIMDYTNSLDCFPNVDIAGGVCYFLRDVSHNGACVYTNSIGGNSTTTTKQLNQYDILIRYPMADSIIAKVVDRKEDTLDKLVTARKPFGLATNVKPQDTGELVLRYNGGTGLYPRDVITSGKQMIDQWKVMISYLTAEHAGQPDKHGQFRVLSTMEVLPPKAICTETYLVAGAFDTEDEARHYEQYLKTRFVRFLIGQVAVSQHITKNCFRFVPYQDFTEEWTDASLYKKYGLTQEEILFIESIMKPMG